jgi:hypothetical protein
VWIPLFVGLLLGAASVAAFVGMGRKGGGAPDPRSRKASALKPASLNWDDLDEDQQDTLRLLSQQKGARLDEEQFSALIDNAGAERWNRIQHRLESNGLTEVVSDRLVLTEAGRALMAGLPERGPWLPEGLVRMEGTRRLPQSSLRCEDR